MRSRIHLKGHPIHPILITFPIAFFLGTFAFDILGFTTDPDFHKTAGALNLAGIAFALLAAIPGAVDYFTIIPPNSSAKSRGAKHGILNFVVVILFAVIAVLRENYAPPLAAALVIEFIAVGLLTASGWMGGTLVYRNQIGVDIRYAYAGKWNEVHIEPKKPLIEIARESELRQGQMKLIHVGGKRIVLARTADGHYAFDDRCTHRGGSLAAGALACDIVQCPWHGTQFNVKDGSIQAGPGKEKIATYPVRIIDGKILLALP